MKNVYSGRISIKGRAKAMKASELIPDLKMIASTEVDEDSGLFKPVVILRWTGVGIGGPSDGRWVEKVSHCFEHGRFASENEARRLAEIAIEFAFKLFETNLL